MPKRSCRAIGRVFAATNLRKEWHKACAAAALGTLPKVEGKPDPSYNGLIIHDLRRSAIKESDEGWGEREGSDVDNTTDVFDRYGIVDTEGVIEAMRRVQRAAKANTNLAPNGERRAQTIRPGKPRKLLSA